MLAGYESKLFVCERLCHKKGNMFIIFNDVTLNCEDKCCRLHVYVYDADFLLPSLRRELVHLSANILPTGYSIDVNNDKGLSCECQFRKIYVKRVNGYRNIVNITHDFDESFDYFSTVRGLIVNRAICRHHDKVSYEEDCYSTFAFFMGMFCQAFTSSSVFFPNWCTRMESTETFDEVVYELRHDVCRDGNVRSSVSYDCDKYDNLHLPREDGMVIQNVYRSPNVDIDVDLTTDSNGYYPKEASKRMHSEFVFYDKSLGASRYEDHGKKHLYEQYHGCKGELMNWYCGVFCASRLLHTNYKQNDLFQVENEEMFCGDVLVDYKLLDNFFGECNDIDFRSKVLSFSTLIPPPASRWSHKVHRVIVTEINSDLSCRYVSLCTIQDPVFINFDDNMMQLHLDDPHFSTDDKDFSHVKFQWHHQCLLSSLTGIMKDYGKVENTVSFTTFKHNLLSVCDKAKIAYNGAHEDFLKILSSA